MENNDSKLILEQYKNYNYSKEQFTNRAFAANRYYMAFCMILLLVCYILLTFTPTSLGVIVACLLGLLLSILWWLNVDTYNNFIKIKYSDVIENLEKSLPASPFTDEFLAFRSKSSKMSKFSFSDVQKTLSGIMFLAFLFTLIYQIYNFINFFVLPNINQ